MILAISILFLFYSKLIPVSCSGGLSVIPRPDTSNQVTASIDDSFVLSCVATGSNEERPKALQWRTPNNQPVQADSNQRVYTVLNGDTLRLYFDKLAPSDSGVYTCAGIEAGTQREIGVSLVLQKKINFYETPIDQFIRGGNVPDQIVICRAAANPGPEIQWFRKGINIELKSDAKYQMTNDGLRIKNAMPEDEGIYICQASVTSTGEVKRLEINVQVMQQPRWITEPKDTEGVLGQDVIIRCEAFAKPAPVYSWTRNGIALMGDRYLVNHGTLTIRNLLREDTATYSCVAENNSGREEAVLKLAVLVGPEIARLDDVYIIEGNRAVMRCTVREAYPRATIRWKYADTQEYLKEDNQNIKIITDTNNADQLGNLVGSWSELHFERVSRLDKRNYTCVAENKAAVSERVGQLLVEYAPKLILNNEAREIYYSWIITDDFGNSGNAASQSSRSYPVLFTCLADGEPKPLITWYFKGMLIKIDNIRYRLLKDSNGLSQIEVNPKSINDFGDYQCRAENRQGREERQIQLRVATTPKFAPLVKVKAINPENILFDIHPSDAQDADGGMPIEAFKLQWRISGTTDWGAYGTSEKEIPIDLTNIDLLTSVSRDVFNIEIGPLMPDTEYLFRASALSKPGQGVWSQKELKVKTLPRRQPDPVRVQSKEDCQSATRCYIEWMVDSTGGSPIREFLLRWRRISYKDPLNQHVNTDRLEPWSLTKFIKYPTSNFEITNLLPNSFYEVDVLARNDIGASASQPFRIRTLTSSPAESEEFLKQNAYKINRGVIIAVSIIGAVVIFLIIDVLFLIKSNCGLMALLRRFCSTDKSNSNEFKTKSPPPKIAQHQPKTVISQSNVQYQPIKTADGNNNVKINMNE